MTTPAAHRPPVHHTVAARPEDLWAVLADGWAYPTWVVGAARVRAVDPGWPAVGTRIEHSVGIWPALLSDHTAVEDCEPGRMLLLRARGWPLGEAHVLIELSATGDGTRVSLREDVVSGPSRVLPVPLRQAAIHPRNVESLRRLALLAERRDPSGRPHPRRAVSGG
ncbi:SRPBCC family protein [Phycicoccus sp. MAQZ13P-2]|uniref:SRPBCC family protein n=1 Tax=Phycicoccus mangrovi TaxID=2840470 RepID=UPI001BFFE52C|nr:SRPBCC family protein [Phycicoccus mangrovi]MBT9255076.1 SRPBCC family protein [Phycicoccus mangrovi]MBT9274060.1 SRPBCC family protein [Phycicoccus mangrovi]